jgi:Ca-activated chloride channel homolog
MRKPLFILGAVLFGAACSSSDSTMMAESPARTAAAGGGAGWTVYGGASGSSGASGAFYGSAGSGGGSGGSAGGALAGSGGSAGGGALIGADAAVTEPAASDAGTQPADAAAYDGYVADDGEAGDDGAAADAAAVEAAANACKGLNRDKPVVLYQSSDDSNSMASPAIARRFINLGQRVPPEVVRTYEFLNYYRVAYEPAPATRVRVVPQMRPSKSPGDYTLQVGIQSEAAPVKRRPMNITFVLDCSGSMTGGPIAIETAAVKAIAASMRAGDRVSMVTWNTVQTPVLQGHVVDGPNDAHVVAAANALQANGSTDLSSGLRTGYQLAWQYYSKDLLNRVVLISDGQANVGITDEQLIGDASHSQDQEGIYLVGVSVGDGINDTLMNVVTDKGRGAYVYLDSADEAVKMLNGRFDETMEVAARGVRLELTLPWYFAMKTFSGEQSSTVAAEVDPQHLAPDDAMIFNETLAPCDPALVKATDTIGAKATYETPIVH